MTPDTENASTLKEPLRFERQLFEKPWGGRALEKLGIELPAGKAIGESWEIADRGDHNSTVAVGAFAGRKLSGLMLSEEEALLGDAKPSPRGNFPLLVKYLTASHALSVQVHPDHATAERLMAGDSGKTECWYVLDAEPGALVYLGLREGVDGSTFCKDVTKHDMVDLLQPWEVRAGQFVFVPAGTVHAVGAGLTLVEIQENSDLTYRIYDWGRTDDEGNARETHLEEAKVSIDFDRPVVGPVDPRFEPCGEASKVARVCESDSFDIELFDVAGDLDLSTGRVAQVLCVTHGSGSLEVEGVEEPWPLERGDTWLLPANLGTYRLQPKGAEFSVLRATTKA